MIYHLHSLHWDLQILQVPMWAEVMRRPMQLGKHTRPRLCIAHIFIQGRSKKRGVFMFFALTIFRMVILGFLVNLEHF